MLDDQRVKALNESKGGLTYLELALVLIEV